MGGNPCWNRGCKDSFATCSEDQGEAGHPLPPVEDYDVLSLKYMKEHDHLPYSNSFFFLVLDFSAKRVTSVTSVTGLPTGIRSSHGTALTQNW